MIQSNVLKDLLEQAGVCFWTDESWRPDDNEIDPASIDDETIVNFVRLLLNYIEPEVGPRSLERIKSRLGIDYDTIAIDMDDETMLLIARASMIEDVTINEFIVDSLKRQLGVE